MGHALILTSYPSVKYTNETILEIILTYHTVPDEFIKYFFFVEMDNRTSEHYKNL